MQLVLKTKRKIIFFNIRIYFTSSQAEIDTLHNTAYKIKKKTHWINEIFKTKIRHRFNAVCLGDPLNKEYGRSDQEESRLIHFIPRCELVY